MSDEITYFLIIVVCAMLVIWDNESLRNSLWKWLNKIAKSVDEMGR